MCLGPKSRFYLKTWQSLRFFFFMIPLITYIQTRISQLILLKFYKAQEGRRTNKPKKTTNPRPPKTLQCLVISLHAFPPLASIPWRICLCVPVDLSEGVLTDALHLILMLFMHLLYRGNSSLHRKTQPQQQSAGPRSLGVFTILDLDQGRQGPCSAR